MTAPQPPKIPPPNSSRLPSNIPLRTLPASSLGHDNNRGRRNDSQSASLLPSWGDDAPHRRLSTSSAGSSWTDTGDIGVQYDDENDPVRLQLPDELEQELLAGVQRRPLKHGKKVRIHTPSPRRSERSQSTTGFIDKEGIEIPHVRPRRPSGFERLVGAIMAGSSGSIHGLTGKALLCALPLSDR